MQLSLQYSDHISFIRIFCPSLVTFYILNYFAFETSNIEIIISENKTNTKINKNN